ncbi:Mutator MutT protein [Nitrospira moscoviensis]|uniref:8-oxo-dGTP diphosphatase n=2 Tax=Nitrospira moscoviensis TaxID=42253 RepID=A0A0K2GCY3_NITMO|nr:Mutator MutT protein [Nitrospira moscoviensis]
MEVRADAMKVVEVAAGLIHHAGRYLIARRKPGVHLAGYWEFPGGKREAGESFEDCLRRELFEELSVRIDVPVPYRIIRHEYPEKTVKLHFYRCAIEAGQAAPIECAEIRWVLPEELPRYKFPPADRIIIEALQQDGRP